jgi:Fur family peroxide stress response transcriptional regulator
LARKIPGVSGGAGGTGAVGDNGSTRYDATVDNHPHLRCSKTGSLHDVPDDLGDQLLAAIPSNIIAKIESELGFRIDTVQIELQGEYQG